MMNDSIDTLNAMLTERMKELNCLYAVEEIINDTALSMDEVFAKIVRILPPGWQYPDVCEAVIEFEDRSYKSVEFKRSSWMQKADIFVQERPIGAIKVYYLEERPPADEGPFLKEERRLINTLSERIGHYLLHMRLKSIFEDVQGGDHQLLKGKQDWDVILDFLRRSDQKLYIRFSRRMMNYLCLHGVEEARHLIQNFGPETLRYESDYSDDANRPLQRATIKNILQISDQTFRIAAEKLSDNEILRCLQKWLQEDKSNFLVRALENQNNSITTVADALARYHHLEQDGVELAEATKKTLNVSLIRRFFTDQLEYINKAKNFVEVDYFFDLLKRMIYVPESHGKLGGKSAGLFLASQIIKKAAAEHEILGNVKVPKTWYISSDVLIYSIYYNDIEEVLEQKYKEIEQVRQEYPHIIQVFKNSTFPPEVVKALSMTLDDFGDQPLIVRSSSLLEDRSGAAFSGKYKSLFLANQGPKTQRLDALIDAINEVYASIFSPDPIEYRTEKGLIDFHEEMGIMIEEVVGTKIGRYFMPAYAGVAFCNNEFRWSHRIKREDGLVRLVPGLGTRAVDRLSDDYPILAAPGQPKLRVNVTPDEVIRYSPQKIDVINLETNSFETIDIVPLLREYGRKYPQLNKIVSIIKDHDIMQPIGLHHHLEEEDIVVTFEGLFTRSDFLKQVKTILDILQAEMGMPVDIEFASDGKDFFLLQCRPQSYTAEISASPIPKDLPEKDIVFSANRHISNGQVPDITHIVYVVPERYTEIENKNDLKTVGEVISGLNYVLPKRQFILMGPGRWGSRGDIKLGVSVTYSDINNTAVLIEIARKKGNYIPDLSFGTHFFQDLVEASIRYLPLYPDDAGIIFNERFLNGSPNILAQILPEYENLSDVIRVIDVPATTGGNILRVLMNADLEEAVGILTKPSKSINVVRPKGLSPTPTADDYWRWRMAITRKIAGQLDPAEYGIKAFYVFGSTKNATAGPGSDIDILIHFNGSEKQKANLLLWLDGWSRCLAEMNYLRTGYKSDGLLDIHLVTDEDIRKKTSYAVKIGAITDAARELPMKGKAPAA